MTENRRQLFPDQNPFSTSAVKPGEIAFQFDGDHDAVRLVAKLQQNAWRGEIVGPHGSGKSTLLKAMLPALEAAGREVRYFVAKRGVKRWPELEADLANWHDATQVMVEGHELMSRSNRKLLDRACHNAGAGLLVTCHASQGLPTLFHTAVTFELTLSIVQHLLPPDCDFIFEADVRDSFSRHGQNLRELLFDMYDLYEQRRPR
ncbi:MAG: hypothetical protein H6822_26535 [Planctomycetaceae bacterium]|nr:hypothetical protein [Planctomycetales bacterium]MCB9925736.1 hypothetical protein [Planctomycetaceae bacterium]